jgi:hypothetical protein
MSLCFATVTGGEHHTLLSRCSSNGCQHNVWLLQVTFVHAHQTQTCIKCGVVAAEIPVAHRGCAVGVHAVPMACTIHLHKHILKKLRRPGVVPHLMAVMAPMLAMPNAYAS